MMKASVWSAMEKTSYEGYDPTWYSTDFTLYYLLPKAKAGMVHSVSG